MYLVFFIVSVGYVIWAAYAVLSWTTEHAVRDHCHLMAWEYIVTPQLQTKMAPIAELQKQVAIGAVLW